MSRRGYRKWVANSFIEFIHEFSALFLNDLLPLSEWEPISMILFVRVYFISCPIFNNHLDDKTFCI